MDRRPSDRVLEEWDSVTRNAQRPAEAPRRRGVASSLGPLTLVPLALVALTIAVGLTRLGATETGPGASAPPPSPGPSAVAVVPSAPPPTPSPSVAVPTSPSPSASEVADRCTVEARITAAEGAAGSRIYSIELRNTGQVTCSIPPVPTARLVDGTGRVLAQYQSPPADATIDLPAGATATTDSSVSNVCGTPPVPPVTIQLELGDQGTVTAKPLDPTDATVPPCNGPTQPSEMSIHPWSR
jgi:hypothetical protein